MLRARSAMECHLYMQLHPCDCGQHGFRWSRNSRAEGHDRVTSTFEGTCGRCGHDRVFVFAIPETFVPPPAFGGASPSEIIDPNDFLQLCQRAAASVPTDSTGLSPQRRDAAADAVETAIAALDEVIKFVPPGGRAVTRECFLTESGRAAYDAQPERFALDQLTAARRWYHELLARLQ